MERFRAGELRVLVATTVIEVGVDVPNASVMIVEHAERFGLSQLHQLRGRVGRGAAKSHCLLLAHFKRAGDEARERLRAMEAHAGRLRDRARRPAHPRPGRAARHAPVGPEAPRDRRPLPRRGDPRGGARGRLRAGRGRSRARAARSTRPPPRRSGSAGPGGSRWRRSDEGSWPSRAAPVATIGVSAELPRSRAWGSATRASCARSPRCRARLFVPAALRARGGRGPAAPHRQRPDHLAAVRGRLHDRAAPARGQRARARGRDRLRVPDRASWRALAREVFSIEIVPELAERRARVAPRRRSACGTCGCGWATARGLAGGGAVRPHPRRPRRRPRSRPRSSRSSRPGGRLILPVGADRGGAGAELVERGDDGVSIAPDLIPVRFVPLTGAGGERRRPRSRSADRLCPCASVPARGERAARSADGARAARAAARAPCRSSLDRPRAEPRCPSSALAPRARADRARGGRRRAAGLGSARRSSRIEPTCRWRSRSTSSARRGALRAAGPRARRCARRPDVPLLPGARRARAAHSATTAACASAVRARAPPRVPAAAPVRCCACGAPAAGARCPACGGRVPGCAQ